MCLVSTLCDSFKEEYLEEVEKISGFQILAGMPDSVREREDGGALTLVYSEKGEPREDNFDLIVILTKPKLPPDIDSLSQKLEQDVV